MALHQSQEAADTLERLYQAHGDTMYRYLLGMLGRREDAEDAAQTVWLNLARRLDATQSIGHWAGYLWTSARNEARSVYRRRRRRWQTRSDTIGLEILPAQVNPDLSPELRLAVEQALVHLSWRQREAIVLVAFEGLTLEAAGRRLGIGKAAVARRYGAAVRHMRTLLEGNTP